MIPQLHVRTAPQNFPGLLIVPWDRGETTSLRKAGVGEQLGGSWLPVPLENTLRLALPAVLQVSNNGEAHRSLCKNPFGDPNTGHLNKKWLRYDFHGTKGGICHQER